MDKRLDASYGRLHISYPENLIQSEHYSIVLQELNDWQILENASVLECWVILSKVVFSSKYYQS